MIEVSVFAAFLAGVLTFFAPCTLPLVPAFLGYLGSSNKTTTNSRSSILLSTILFCLGFSVVFIILGSSLGFVSQSLISNQAVISQIGGGLILLFGIYLLIRNYLPTKNSGVSGFSIKQYVNNTFLNAFIIGIIFGFSFSPCLGPILGAILTLAVTSTSPMGPIVLLTAYSAGLSLPFIMLGIFYTSLSEKIEMLSPKTLKLIEVISALLLIGFGLLLLTGSYGVINAWLLDSYEIGFIDRFGDLL